MEKTMKNMTRFKMRWMLNTNRCDKAEEYGKI